MCWGFRFNKKKKVGWPLALIFLCFVNVDMIWSAASNYCHVSPTTMYCCTLKLEDKNKPFLSQVAFVTKMKKKSLIQWTHSMEMTWKNTSRVKLIIPNWLPCHAQKRMWAATTSLWPLLLLVPYYPRNHLEASIGTLHLWWLFLWGTLTFVVAWFVELTFWGIPPTEKSEYKYDCIIRQLFQKGSSDIILGLFTFMKCAIAVSLAHQGLGIELSHVRSLEKPSSVFTR